MRSFLSVIVVNYKTPVLTVNLLASLMPEIECIDTRVVVVDNHSGDESVHIIESWIANSGHSKNIEVIKSPKNNGFSSGNNFGINAVDSNFYLLLNSDTIICQGALNSLLHAMESYPAVGVLSPRLEWPDGAPQISCFRFHRPGSEIISASNTGFIAGLFQTQEVIMPVCECAIMPEWTSFACVLIRKKVFDSVGLMDEDFFMYYEDTEFCFRAKKAGWEVMNIPQARVVHLRGGSSNVKNNAKMCKRLPKYYYESRTKYYYKCYGWHGLLLANMCWLLGHSVSWLREILGNKKRHLPEKAWVDIWTNFFYPNRASVMFMCQK